MDDLVKREGIRSWAAPEAPIRFEIGSSSMVVYKYLFASFSTGFQGIADIEREHGSRRQTPLREN